MDVTWAWHVIRCAYINLQNDHSYAYVMFSMNDSRKVVTETKGASPWVTNISSIFK